MARSTRAQTITLAVLAVILAAAIWWNFGRDSDPAPAAAVVAGSATAPGAVVKDAVRPVPPVALARLRREAVEPSDTGRDPFRFGTGRAAQAGRAGGRGAAGSAGAGQAAPIPVPPPTPALPPADMVPAGPPPPPPIPLKYIALVVTKRGGAKIAMLTDGRGVYSGTEGTVIEGRYRLIRIGNDSIDVAYVDGRGRRTIPLSGT